MTFKERIRSHIGGLIRLKTQLYWQHSNSWDGVEGRICVLLNITFVVPAMAFTPSPADGLIAARRRGGAVTALLLIDNFPVSVSLSKEAVEFIQ